MAEEGEPGVGFGVEPKAMGVTVCRRFVELVRWLGVTDIPLGSGCWRNGGQGTWWSESQDLDLFLTSASHDGLECVVGSLNHSCHYPTSHEDEEDEYHIIPPIDLPSFNLDPVCACCPSLQEVRQRLGMLISLSSRAHTGC